MIKNKMSFKMGIMVIVFFFLMLAGFLICMIKVVLIVYFLMHISVHCIIELN